jgi:flavin-dependent dehydrogenase
MTEPGTAVDIAIVGAGPVGMTLALALWPAVRTASA